MLPSSALWLLPGDLLCVMFFVRRSSQEVTGRVPERRHAPCLRRACDPAGPQWAFVGS